MIGYVIKQFVRKLFYCFMNILVENLNVGGVHLLRERGANVQLLIGTFLES